MALENTNREQARFEEWYGDNCPTDERERMFEKNATGNYVSMNHTNKEGVLIWLSYSPLLF